VANLSSNSFLNRWHILHRATIPNPECAQWQVGGVTWRRQRHAFAGDGYSFAVEVHTLAFPREGKRAWSLMVVTEHWWGRDKEVLRSTTWAKRLAGDARSIWNWVREHEAVRRAAG
jgi:hypothetical protein